MNQAFKNIASLSQKQRLLLEQRLQEKRNQTQPSATIPRRQGVALPPLSFAQQRLWFLHQLYPESAFYNITMAIQLSGSVNLAALEQTFATIVERHENLRTTFKVVDGQLVQIIAQEMALSVSHIDLRMLLPEIQETEVVRLANEEAGRPFDLSVGPLIRLKMVLIDAGIVLLLTLHHAISDGWSTGIFIEEVGKLYPIYMRGELSRLPALPIQYADYAVWQREWLNDARMKTLLEYWTTQLANLPVLQLPTDYPRPIIPTHTGGVCVFQFSEDLSARIHKCCSQEKVTSFIFLLAAFQVLLFRYSHQDDIAVGIPISNRPYPELEPLIGFLTNTLVLRSDLTGNPTFRELLTRVREVALNGYTYQDLPFEKLVEALRPKRDLSYAPLFQVMFNLQKSKLDRIQLPGLEMRSILPLKGTSLFDLTVNVEEDETRFSGIFEYNQELFVTDTVRRMIESFQTLLSAIVADIDQPILQLSLISRESQQQVIHTWNNTAVAYPQDICFHEAFEAQVERTPDAIAVVYNQHALSYRELNRRANQLAHYLYQQGVGPEITVGLCLERSVEMLIGLLAILKAGGAYVAFAPEQAPARQKLMVDDAKLHLLITQESLLPLVLQSYQQQVFCLDRDWSEIQHQEEQNLPGRVSSKHLAYIIYTSGSTGSPKGIMIEHRTLMNFCYAFEQAIYTRHQGKLQRVGLNAPLTFDGSIKQLLLLMRGQTIYIIPQEIRADGQAFLAFLNQTQLDIFDSTPTQLRLLLHAGLFNPQVFAPQVVVSSGESIDKHLWHTLAQAPTTTFYNVYGPTECTVDTTVCPVTPDSMPAIGRPIANTQVYILDEMMAPVPIGVSGELFIGGEGVSRGYVGRPDVTAATFVPHPFSTQPGARLYKTGDAARFLPNGMIEFIGRLDWQIKFHGFRVEPGEIEAVAGQYPGVKQAVILAREDVHGEQQLVAYVAVDQQQPPMIAELRAYLKLHFPHYMVPSHFVIIDTLPIGPNGKLNRKALPSPQTMQREVDETYVAPRSDLERQISAIWCSVLNVEKVGIYDNFFDLGGHSLSLVKVHQQIQEQFDTTFSLIEMYRHPTVSGQIDHLLHKSSLGLADAHLSDQGARQREAAKRQKRLSKQKKFQRNEQLLSNREK
jgi:amino acid adenylation domain-containing protein